MKWIFIIYANPFDWHFLQSYCSCFFCLISLPLCSICFFYSMKQKTEILELKANNAIVSLASSFLQQIHPNPLFCLQRNRQFESRMLIHWIKNMLFVQYFNYDVIEQFSCRETFNIHHITQSVSIIFINSSSIAHKYTHTQSVSQMPMKLWSRFTVEWRRKVELQFEHATNRSSFLDRTNEGEKNNSNRKLVK